MEELAIATGEKSFSIWREPSEREEKGMAEGVGIPSRAFFPFDHTLLTTHVD